MHSLTSPPPKQDDAFYLTGTVTEVTDGATWDRVTAQFLAEREIESRWPGFEAQVLFELDIQRCLLTLTGAEDELPASHSVWRANDSLPTLQAEAMGRLDVILGRARKG